MLVSRNPRMQVITRIVLGSKLTWNGRISQKHVEVSNGVERPRVANEVVDLLPATSVSTLHIPTQDEACLVASLTGLEYGWPVKLLGAENGVIVAPKTGMPCARINVAICLYA